MPTVIDRIMVRCVTEDRGYETPCLIWKGTLAEGYGRIRVGSRSDGTRRMAAVHRIMYEYARGPIPADLCPDHLCRQRDCCNPDHIEPVTHGENVRRGASPDALRRKFAAMTHCCHGHEYTPENTYRWKDSRGNVRRVCRTCKNERRRRP